ncbi:hypothetical protein FKM82_010370 [Ascaphus truei]
MTCTHPFFIIPTKFEHTFTIKNIHQSSHLVQVNERNALRDNWCLAHYFHSAVHDCKAADLSAVCCSESVFHPECDLNQHFAG